MNSSFHSLLKFFLILIAFYHQVKTEDPLSIEEFSKECADKFQSKCEAPDLKIKLHVANHDLFDHHKKIIPPTEKHYESPQSFVRLIVKSEDGNIFYAEHFKMKGYFQFEKFVQHAIVGSPTRENLEGCEAIAIELSEFLKTNVEFGPFDFKSIFVEKFEIAANKNANLKLVDITESFKSPTISDALVLAPAKNKGQERQLTGNKLEKYMLLLVDEAGRSVGHISFRQSNPVSMIVYIHITNIMSFKTFVSFSDKRENIEKFIEDLVKQVHAIEIREDVSIDSLITKTENMMSDLNCWGIDDKLTKFENSMVLNWIPTEEQLELNMGEGKIDFRKLNIKKRARMLPKENECPFTELTIIFIKSTVNGYPNLNVYFEGNNQFLVPEKLDYFIIVKNPDEAMMKIDALWNKFVSYFKNNLVAKRKFATEYEEYSKRYNEYLQGPSQSDEIPQPKDPTPKKLSVHDVALMLKNSVDLALQKSESKTEISLVQKKSDDPNGSTYISVISTKNKNELIKFAIIPDSYPRIQMLFISFIHDDGTKHATYQIDVTSDPRLNQMEVVKKELDEYFKSKKRIV